MFVGVARLTLQIPGRRLAEVQAPGAPPGHRPGEGPVQRRGGRGGGPGPLAAGHHRAGGGGQRRRHVDEQMEKIIHFVEEMYVAPLLTRELEILAFGDQLFGGGGARGRREHARAARFAREDRSLAEAEGMAEWDRRHGRAGAGTARVAGRGRPRRLAEARARARKLRNKRDWEKRMEGVSMSVPTAGAGGAGDPGGDGRAAHPRRAARPAHRLHHHHRGEGVPGPAGGEGLLFVLGTEAERKETQEGLDAAKGFVRREVTSRVKLRVSPEVFFVFDESVGEGDKIDRLLREVKTKEGW